MAYREGDRQEYEATDRPSDGDDDSGYDEPPSAKAPAGAIQRFECRDLDEDRDDRGDECENQSPRKKTQTKQPQR
jgi:hypothetical protein